MPIPASSAVSKDEKSASSSYVLPLVLVTSLFFLWGLANILNSALIAHFQPVFEISSAQSLLVETAFYFGYFTIAVPAGLFMERFSYKKGILLGLALYAIGAFLFIPAAKTITFAFFLFALYVIASGLAFLETGANPYVILLGDPATSSRRLNLSQSFNGLALLVGPWLAGQFIFSGNEGALITPEAKQQAAEAVILPYAGIGIVVVMVAILFYIARMPEPDKGQRIRFNMSIFSNRQLMFAVVAQLFYVGAQVGIWGLTLNYVIELIPGTSREEASKEYMLIGTALFVVGRIAGTFLLSYIKDSRLLMIYGGAACALCVAAMLTHGEVAVYAFLSINFFMSIMFPTIFALGVKGLGDEAKLGASLIIMAIVGGAILPPLMGLIRDHFHIQVALVIPALCFLVVLMFGIRSGGTTRAH